MISLNSKDRDVLRFLWVKDPFSSEPEIVVWHITNCPSLQSLVDSQETSLKNPQGTKLHPNVVEADETYMEATLRTSSNKHPIEQKVLGVR